MTDELVLVVDEVETLAVGGESEDVRAVPSSPQESLLGVGLQHLLYRRCRLRTFQW